MRASGRDVFPRSESGVADGLEVTETGQLCISLKIVEIISMSGWNTTLSETFDRAGGTVNAAHCDLPPTKFKIPFSVNFWRIPEVSVGLREPNTERMRVA